MLEGGSPQFSRCTCAALHLSAAAGRGTLGYVHDDRCDAMPLRMAARLQDVVLYHDIDEDGSVHRDEFARNFAAWSVNYAQLRKERPVYWDDFGGRRRDEDDDNDDGDGHDEV